MHQETNSSWTPYKTAVLRSIVRSRTTELITIKEMFTNDLITYTCMSTPCLTL